MTFVVTAPLVVAAGPDGALGYHYQGQPIDWLSEEDAQRLIADGMIENVSGSALSAPVVDQDASDNGDQTDAPKQLPERPAPTDPKPDWIAYGIAAGLDAAAVEGMTKPQIAAAVEELQNQQ